MIEQVESIVVEFFSHENVKAFFTMLSAIFIVVGTKMVAGNIHKQKGMLGNVAFVAKSVKGIKSTVNEEKTMLNVILEVEKKIENKLDKVAEGEEIIVEMFKKFFMSTSIDIGDKLELAEMYDKFKKLDLQGEMKKEIKETKAEVFAQVKQHKEDKLTKINAYKQALIGTGDEDDGKDDSQTDKT